MKHTTKITSLFKRGILGSLLLTTIVVGCKHSGKNTAVIGDDAASKVYVAPGKYDDFYLFTSGGFSGQMGVYGLPSGRLFKVIPVFSQNAENAWGYSEETKPMLQTTHGFVPWGDSHHPQLSRKDGSYDGRWLFINENNTPRIARLDLKTFTTSEIIEIPNCAGNHSSPYCTENTEYLAAGGRFSIPLPNKDVPISSYKETFKGVLSLVKVGPTDGKLDLAFQILLPPFDFDLTRAGKGVSKDWF